MLGRAIACKDAEPLYYGCLATPHATLLTEKDFGLSTLNRSNNAVVSNTFEGVVASKQMPKSS